MRKKVVVRGPCLTQSGYGEHTRMVLRALKTREDLFDIYIVPTGWGQTGWQHENSPERIWTDQIINKTQQYIAARKPFDISLQVSIPNEWEHLAPVNIGVTAGIETTKVSPDWIQKGNMMDKIIITSEHSKQVYENTTYAANDNLGNPVELKLSTPVEIVSYPAKGIIPDKELNIDFDHDFNYVFVGQWGPRKNVDNLVKWWLEENWSENVGLILKVSHAKNNLFDKNHTKNRIKYIQDSINLDAEDKKCKVYLIHGDMTEMEIISLYHHPKVKCMVSVTHGEGFGLPLFDFAQAGKPVIATEWSAHLDFLTKKDKRGKNINAFLPVSYDMQPIPPNVVWQGVIVEDSMWAYPHEGSFKHRLRQVRKNKKWLERAQDHAPYIMKNLSEDKIYGLLCSVVGDDHHDNTEWWNTNDELVEYE
jgi:glycosyltransferase involved in cell wall biosynthesis